MKQAGLVLAILLAAGLACGGDEPRAADTQATAPPPQEFAIGQPVEIGDWTLTVHGVEYPAGGDWRPEAGMKLVMVDVEVANRGDGGSLAAALNFEVKDSENRTYSHHIAVAAPGDEPDGEFSAGEVKRGPVVFQVPEDAGGFVFVFEPGLLERGRAFARLE